MTLWDGLLVLTFTVIFPASSAWYLRDKKKFFSTFSSIKRRGSYRTTILAQWAMGFALVVLWVAEGRSWNGLGFNLQTTGLGFWVSIVLAAACLLYLYLQLRQVSEGKQNAIQNFRDEVGDLVHLLPHDKQDLRHFYAVSITAGIIEELLFRGFLMWLMIQFMPLWAAFILGTLAFGFAHSYQGLKHLPPLLFFGAILMGVFVLSGSLWIPMLLHIFWDVLQGRMAYKAISYTEPTPEAG